MSGKKYFSPFWISITIILCILFFVLFFPLALEQVGLYKAIVYSIVGIAVIWLANFARAIIFADMNNTGKENKQPKQDPK